MKYDMIIVGARCAGSATALLLARKGYRVLLADKASFPSDTMSGHFIHTRGLACLQRWNVLDRLLATDIPRVPRTIMDTGEVVLEGETLPIDGINYSMGPRRYIIDTLLVQAAVEAGAELREKFTVQRLLEHDGTIVGIQGRTAGGEVMSDYASMVIGADGMHSLVAREVNAPVYQTHNVLTCCYYSHWSNLPLDTLQMYLAPQGSVVAFPTNNNLALIGISLPYNRFNEVRLDVTTNFLATVALLAPMLSALTTRATLEERFMGTGDLPNFFRKPYGPGWALIGDAGYHTDPVLGEGISNAFIEAERLVQFIDRGLSEAETLPAALAEYEVQRNQESIPLYEMTMGVASFKPNVEMDQLYHALAGNQADTMRFMGVIEGSVPVEDFFAPKNIQRIISSVQH
jgi:flavin-dependent dehydrogenase